MCTRPLYRINDWKCREVNNSQTWLWTCFTHAHIYTHMRPRFSLWSNHRFSRNKVDVAPTVVFLFSFVFFPILRMTPGVGTNGGARGLTFVWFVSFVLLPATRPFASELDLFVSEVACMCCCAILTWVARLMHGQWQHKKEILSKSSFEYLGTGCEAISLALVFCPIWTVSLYSAQCVPT